MFLQNVFVITYMSKMHLQVNMDGSTDSRETLLWPGNKASQQKILTDLFSSPSWTVSRVENIRGAAWEVEVSSPIKSYKIKLYVGSVRDEKRSIDEFKIQLSNAFPSGETAGWITMILGVYSMDRQDGTVDFILTGHKKDGYNFSGNPSLRGIRTSDLQKAYINGFVKKEKTCIFRPDFLYYYITNIVDAQQLPDDSDSNSGSQAQPSIREDIQEEFKFYLSNCVKSRRTTNGNFKFEDTAVSSYLTFIEPSKLFDYNPTKWANIESMYDYTQPEKVDSILNDLLNDPSFVEKDKGTSQGWRSGSIMYYSLFIHARDYFLNLANINKSKNMFKFFFDDQVATDYSRYVNAFMTKPFVLLAGISGTGKSRIVRKFAQATDDIDVFKNDEDRWTIQKPENFELIQVKPNWHNSLDVVGYKSNIGKPHYELTPFVRFVAKAWRNPDTPFFLCLDEMNLAPVEQYFAEYLSAIESRSFDENTKQYETDPIIRPFNDFGKDVADQMIEDLLGDKTYQQKKEIEERFRKKGLTLPQNLIVMGTVNMDETTFSFSRKVLDRAMSIEMNEVDFKNCMKPNPTDNPPVMVDDNAQLINRPIKSITVIDGNEGVNEERTLLSSQEAEDVVKYLNDINVFLEGTPFKLGYRACNEALLYLRASKESSHSGDNFKGHALDEFTTMKILSRIEGEDSKLFVDEKDPRIENLGLTKADVTDELFKDVNLLSCLKAIIKKHISGDSKSVIKINEMNAILHRDHFVSYWG